MRKLTAGIIGTTMAAVICLGSVFYSDYQSVNDIPELVSYVDDSIDGGVEIEEDEVPLASKPTTTSKTTTKTSTKKYTLKSKSKKTYSSTKTSTKTSSKTQNSSKKKVVTKTTVKTTEKSSFKKNSKVKTVQTTVKTTVNTTTTQYTTTSTVSKASSASKQYVAVNKIAPKAHSNVISAYNTMNFKVLVNPSVTYSGQFDAAKQLITVQKNSTEAIYHELGHFVAFVAGNADTKSEFKSIYAAEKSQFDATRGNKNYIISTPSEYFAESYQDYIERPKVLQQKRPKTYAYIVKCVAKVTTKQANALKTIYGF